ncbi:MAG: HhH-GPD family protein [Candidatus Magasanikbacteria bacterium GW2011_GWD2_43_18]|uniref:Adenine DNA glycosylase n=1 Tax=Candidatus Magasanikbacteria bacterium GW2011_GWE2_42_7 TaxID=1619052 RepID=A0A0G1BG34_9BACT|nr:MAG: HhH-GPD family protein [Candidatus Magasanikbacteria bacterium GW2011_GWC2_42_27]KKS72257.1 MAG: HhH-GPD family protein [Candidatus Magasanikbacteria bacterium GW2011_GWE2_42_7]KKT04407.1 MAG: HhH-GPD family protein [Candidatus Magasanikbacteria bacterium GW2011_GWD2_43_18]KKT25160.1 MAG: HhH-GPD family protein [Candidatus Magasanikbacteria bacterium GW2011_GWA2_43_9]HBB37636.1 A/G-specific adenine glycosylase [Candidatus Magasanikbacteria bacterium]
MTKKQQQQCLTILAWYAKEGRDLPWRKTRNPYRILVSEIMLQQTQVPRVIEKYKEFLRAFPTIQILAGAKTSEVITVWKGLGYNRRALFLQRTAQAVQQEFHGRFPKNLEELKSLPGVGDYTARAILSFAFDQPTPVLDTNHRKFYQKTFFGDDLLKDDELLKKAEEVVRFLSTVSLAEITPTQPSPKRGGRVSIIYHWNQALMDWVSAYPEQYQFPKTKKQKKAIPFKQTDRYFRGRIVDALREKKKISVLSLRKRFPEITDERFGTILKKLESDKLIIRQNRSILLP